MENNPANPGGQSGLSGNLITSGLSGAPNQQQAQDPQPNPGGNNAQTRYGATYGGPTAHHGTQHNQYTGPVNQANKTSDSQLEAMEEKIKLQMAQQMVEKMQELERRLLQRHEAPHASAGNNSSQ